MVFVVCVSLLVQLLAAAVAVRRMVTAARPGGWAFVAAALVLLSTRRGITFVRLVSGDIPDIVDPVAEWFALGASFAFLAGLAWVTPLFESIRQSGGRIGLEQDFLKAVLEHAGDGIVACDAGGTLRLFNRATNELHGIPAEPIGPEQWAEHYNLCLPDGTTRMAKEQIPLFRALTEGRVEGVEMVVAPKGRPPRVVMANGRAVFDDAGRKLGAVVVMHDITDRKALLRERERLQLAQLATILSSVEEGIVAADPSGNVIEWNAAALSIHGFTDLAEAQKHLSKLTETFDLTTPDGEPIPLERWPMSRALRGEVFARSEVRLRHPDQGWEKFITYSGTSVRDAGGGIALGVLTLHDITERKRAEELLVQNRRQMEIVVKGANVGVWYCPLPFDRLVWDAKVKEHFHLGPDAEVTIETFYERIHPDDRERTREAIDDSIGKMEAYDIEYRTVSPGGERTKWIRASGRGFYDAAGDPIRFDGITIDVTAQKRAEASNRFLVALDDAMRPLTDPVELTLTAARLLGEHLAADRCAYADIEADEDTMNLTGNYKRTPEVVSIVGRLKFADFGAEVLRLMRDDEPYVVHDIDVHVPPVGDKAAYRATQIQAVICVPLHKGGRFVAAMAVHQMVPRRWADDEVALVRQVASRCWESIERARVARALREADEFHRFAAEAGRTGSWYVRLDTMECVLSPMMAELMGFPAGQTTASAEQWRESVVPEDRAGLERAMMATLERGVPFDHEFRIVLPGGAERWLYSHGGAVRDAHGKPVRLYGASVDVTERKRAESALRASEGRYRSIVDQSVAGIAEVDRGGLFRMVNDRYCAMLGYSREELLSRRMQDLTHPDDLPRNAGMLNDAIANRSGFEIEKRYIRKDGSLLWVHNSVSPVHDGDGSLQGVVAVSVDIGAIKAAELRSQSILESITDGFYALDRDWRFAYVNAAAERVLLRSRGELVGRNIWQEFPGAIGTNFEREYKRAMADGVTTQFVEHYPPPLNGWYEVRAYPSADGLSVYFQDITERRKAEQALAEVRQRLELAVDAGELGTFYCPMPLGEIVWNDKCKEHFFLPADAGVDFDLFYSILHEDDRERTRVAIEQAVFDRKGYDIQYRTVAKDGEFRWIRAKGRAYYDDEGKPTRFDGITIDVTDSKRVEQERERLLEGERVARVEAERAGRLKDEFLATLSHELRTPLNAILGWSQILRGGRMGDLDSVEEGLDIIERNARVQAQLISDLLDMSSIISGKVRLNVQRVTLPDVVESAFASVRPSAEAKGIHLGRVIDPAAGPVWGDPDRLQQVFWNLLTNAIKFTPRGGRIQVAVARLNSHAAVSVTDTGKGMSAEFLPYVFDRFRQADASTTRQHGGLGIGLSIVKQLVELHGGTVTAASGGEGKGATFVVSLPLSPVLEAGSRAVPGVHPAGSSKASSHEDCERLDGVKVLVVDDEADSRSLVKRVLGDCGAEVTTAGSAGEGLLILREARPDVLLTDIGMPIEDGYSLIRQVRMLPAAEGGRVPAAALTAFARTEDRQRALRAGFQIHIPKPVDPGELIAIVASLAARGRT